MKRLSVLCMLLMLVLVGCNFPQKTEKLVEETRTYTITHVDRPKHVRATLQDDEGRTYKVYLGKYYSGWDSLQNKTVTTLYVEWKYDNGEVRYELPNARSDIGRLRE